MPFACTLLCAALLPRSGAIAQTASGSTSRAATAAMPPVVLDVTNTSAGHVAAILRGLFPHASVRVDASANALIVVAPPNDVTAIRAVVSGVDVKSPDALASEAMPLHGAKPAELVSRLTPLFRNARFTAAPNRTLLVFARPQELAQIRSVVGVIDAAIPPPPPKAAVPATTVRVQQGDPGTIARAAARSFPQARIGVSGSSIVVLADPDVAAQAKSMIASLDVPARAVRFTEVYRLRSVDAASVAALLGRSFHDASFEVDKDLNAITVLADGSVQQRVADAVAQLDASPAPPNGAQGQSQGGSARTEVVALHAVTPSFGTGPSTTAADIAQTVTQSLQEAAPDLHITVHPNSTRLVLTGSAYSLRLAEDLIAKLDVAEPLVELDTQVLEVDQNVQKQLGFRFPSPVLGSTYSETTPGTASDGSAPRLIGLQSLARTPLTLSAQLDFLVSTNKARILEDPRITTFSGRTASLRAGETVNILTTTGGGTGTVATTQVQSFQTGVTLDITPIVNTDDYITVTLHPSVNSEAGIGTGGVPNIQTRDTTTTVGLHDGETIVIGGLIEDADARSVQKVPILGDLPIIGRLFQDVGVSHSRNELVVTVTPHILRESVGGLLGHPVLPPISPVGLPTLRPDATLRPMRPRSRSGTAPPVPPPALPSPAPALDTGPVPTDVPSVAAADAGAAEHATPGPVMTPDAVPSAFAQTNTFTFGAPPTSNFAGADQAPQIYFVEAKPTVVRDGVPLTISVVTSTNVTSLSFGPTATAASVSLAMVGEGKWRSTFAFSASGLPSVRGNVNELLTAKTSLGATTSLRVPFSLTP